MFANTDKILNQIEETNALLRELCAEVIAMRVFWQQFVRRDDDELPFTWERDDDDEAMAA